MNIGYKKQNTIKNLRKNNRTNEENVNKIDPSSEATAQTLSRLINENFQNNNYDDSIEYIHQLSNLLYTTEIRCIDYIKINNIPDILLFFLQNDKNTNFKIISLNCITLLTARTPNLCSEFCQPTLIGNLITMLRTEKDQTHLAKIITLIYNLLCTKFQPAINFFLENMTFPELREIIRGKSNGDLISSCFDLFQLITQYPIESNACGELLVLIKDFSITIDKDDLTQSFSYIISHLIETNSLNYEAFDQLGYFDMINNKLKDMNQKNIPSLCRIISSLYNKYKCNYLFDIDRLKSLIFHEKSMKKEDEQNAVSAAYAFHSCLKVNHDLTIELINEDFIATIIKCFQYRTIKCKVAIIKIIHELCFNATEDMIKFLLIDVNKVSILTLVSEILEILNEDVILEALDIIYQIIQISEYNIVFSERCMNLFLEAFPNKGLFTSFSTYDENISQKASLIETYITSKLEEEDTS